MSDHSQQDDGDLDDLIHAADLDGLVRMIDDRCASADWDGLLRLRDRSRSAVKTGRQLWPAATLAEYRLALLAPARHVAAVLDETDGLSGQFTIGPLTEVAAQHHTWDALQSEIDPSPRAPAPWQLTHTSFMLARLVFQFSLVLETGGRSVQLMRWPTSIGSFCKPSTPCWGRVWVLSSPMSFVSRCLAR